MPRRHIDLRKLPHGLGYLIAGAVAALVILLAYRASVGHPVAPWWTDYATPIIYWSSPFLIALVVLLSLRRRKRPPAAGDETPK